MPTVNMPSRRPSAMDRLASGLGLANAILGLKNNMDVASANSDERARLARLDDPNSKESVSDYDARTASGQKVPKGLSFNQYKANDPYYKEAFTTALKVPEKKNVLAVTDLVKAQQDGTLTSADAPGALKVPAIWFDGTEKMVGIRTKPKDGAALTTPKAPTEAQSKAALFGKRIQQAEGVFSELEGKGFNRADDSSAFESAIVPGRFQGENVKRWQQAERNFINSVLRRESGAVISDEEYANAELQYFPRAGDTDEVRRQKAENRALAMTALEAESGDAWARIEAKQGPAQKAKSAGLMQVPEAVASSGRASFSAEDLDALKWVKSNPKDPRAGAIMERLKGKGLR